MKSPEVSTALTRAVLYVRVSTDEQAQEGQSIDAQLRALRDFCASKQYLVVEEYVDDGFSGTTAKRPAFQSMVTAARRKPRPFDLVLIHKQDRFARNREDAIVFKNLLRRDCGVDVISLVEPFEDSPQGRLMEGIMESMAEFYSANLGQEVLKGMTEKARKGGALGLPPLGYGIDPETGRYIVQPERARIVQWIFESYDNGMAMRAIAVALADHGAEMFPDPPPYRWSQPAVRSILRNESYTGVQTWGKRQKGVVGFRSEDQWIRVEGAHEQIVDHDLFQRVQEKISRNTGGHRSKWGDYLLKGLCECGNCGGGMSFHKMQSRATRDGVRVSRDILACTRYYSELNHGGCYFNWIDIAEIHQSLSDILRTMLLDTVDLSQVEFIFADDRSARRTQLVRSLQLVEQRYKRQMTAYEEGIKDLKELREDKARYLTDKERMQAEIEAIDGENLYGAISQAEIRRRISLAVDALSPEAQETPLPVRRAVLEEIIHSIIWDRRTGTLRLRFKAPSN